jgi:hypothetical protein
VKINKINGILLPDNIIPTKNITINNGTINLEYFFDTSEKKNGTRKKEKKENLCMKLPAISSSPNGPPSFLVSSMISYPKISLPFKN